MRPPRPDPALFPLRQVLGYLPSFPSFYIDLARYTWNGFKKMQEIVYLRIDCETVRCYNQKVFSKTLMTDGTVEHHME